MQPWHSAASAWMAQRGYLFPWVPVALACGIGLYFSLKSEPQPWVYAGLVAGAIAMVWGTQRLGFAIAPFGWALALLALGTCLAAVRAHTMADPVLGWRYYGPVEGRVVGMDRSGSDALRLTLDRVVLRNISPARTPGRVRVSLHNGPGSEAPRPGDTIILTAHLSPPGGPVEPGGFDFQRHAWFKGLGAVGYTRTPVLRLAPPERGQWLFKARMALSARVQSILPGESGAFAAAIMTGDRSGIGQETLRALRVSNLAHLLAISGLHMGLLAGFVFGSLRVGFALVPRIGLRVTAKKISAVGALIAAAGYLALSGGNVATERAFVMVAVMLLAVLADRRALSLRAVAMAACIILTLRPEALLGPGFQMSFAATTALVAVFNGLRDVEIGLGPRWLRPIGAVVLSSFVAGLATAPIAAAHFNQIAHYGLVANLLSVPLMGIMVMPMAVLAALLLPFGLDWVALRIMQFGLDWILGVSHWISGLDGARGTVMTPGPAVLPLIALGALLVILWQGRARIAGIIPMIVGVWLWSVADRPAVLIADTGGLVGIMTDQGRALSKPRGSSFVASNWLENDGDASDQEAAHARWVTVAASGWPVTALRGKKAAAAFDSCGPEEWIVLSAEPATTALPCTIIHPGNLKETGALALYRDKTGIRALSARDVTGIRLWNAR
ncbi:MAG: ComEC/Rec2 family competence protein [Pseudomonadota bacterium]